MKPMGLLSFYVRVLFVLVSLTAVPALGQTIRYVSTNGSNPAPATATTWANSTADLQGAINASASGDQVWVEAGTYTPTTTTGPDSRTISFAMKNGVAIYGGFVGNKPALGDRPTLTLDNPSGTILSGDIGFIDTFSDNSYHVIDNPGGLTNSAVLDGFVITGGNANQTYSVNITGGGMHNVGSSPTLVNCTFQGNRAMYGGGLANENGSNPHLFNCLFQDNRATNAGGGMANDRSVPVVTNCLFKANDGFLGGGMGNFGSTPVITNCAFRANVSAGYGGGVFNTDSNARLVNCSFQGNTAGKAGGIYNESNSQTRLTNCVVFGNGAGSPFFVEAAGSLLAAYCLFNEEATGYGYTGTNTNLTTATSPFASANSTELATNSPAIDAGDPGTTATTVGTTDLAGLPRFSNGRIDMGAYEYQGGQLPVTLIYFSGRMTDAGATLGWQTAREDNNAYFQIERGHDIQSFESIGTVASQAPGGTSLDPLTYAFTDAQPLPGTGYYRLVQTDRNGTRTMSRVIALLRDTATPTLFPNPVAASGETRIDPAIVHRSYQLIDVLGQVVQRTDAPGVLSRLSLSGLAAGMYLLRVQTEGGTKVFRVLR